MSNKLLQFNSHEAAELWENVLIAAVRGGNGMDSFAIADRAVEGMKARLETLEALETAEEEEDEGRPRKRWRRCRRGF